MSDRDILDYLVSHAPIERFYIFIAPNNGGALMKYFDKDGRSWSIMEDDEETVERAVSFLKRSGVKVFNEYASLLEFEQEDASSRD